MPKDTDRLNLPLPLGNENVTRESINTIFEKIDAGVATQDDLDALREAVSKMDIPDASLTQKGKVQLSDAINSDAKDKAATSSAVKLAFDEATSAKQLGVEQKVKVVAALNSINVSASTNEAWGELITKISNVIVATGNVTTTDVLAGKVFSNAIGNNLTGSMPNRGAPTLQLGGSIPNGYYSGGSIANYSHGSQLYDVPGKYTFTVPSGINLLFLIIIGAGGGGGYGSSSSMGEPGGGGGAGGIYIKELSVSPGSSYNVIVGVGGEGYRGGGYYGSGSAGGSSSFGDLIAVGGAGGYGSKSGGYGGAGGGYGGKGGDGGSNASSGSTNKGGASGGGIFGAGGNGSYGGENPGNGGTGRVIVIW
ncbi:tail fiber protein [Paenibacillus silvae]|uniref:glycine-rich domain-containing protein n=1 Tax=Paenibacillus silvae TaxID=1325358 RepID=UPI00200532B7|nr:tail fiber protein [Paenibacillus silvae]MCK6077894.1 phage tail protein [Paenibacillus silvae]MCK6152093.1 phage tail protein [Paenibacillus silvae]MCK6270778.1 phage tail protein [Paenibacillus silvae]